MYNRSWGHWQDLTELQSSSPPQISKNSMLKYQHVEMWQKSKEKRFPYKSLSSPPKKWKNERRHEFCNPDTILVFIIIGAETRPCVVSRGPIHLFYFQVCLLSLFCIKSYLCIWYVREGKILVNLDVACLKGNMKMFFKKWFLAWFINPVSVELQLTLETKFEWAISNLSGNNGKNGSALTKKLLLSQIKL